MYKQKAFYISLLVTMMFFCFSAVTLAATQPGYYVEGKIDQRTGEFVVTISIENIEATIGRFGIDYDENKLTLKNADVFGGAIHANKGIVLNQDGYAMDKLISENDGYAMFAWYTSDSKLDATSQRKTIATLYFELSDDITKDDFDWDTVRLLDMKSVADVTWPSGAFLRDFDLNDYFYNVDSELPCSVDISYPNSNIRPENTRLITFMVKDGAGKGLPAEILVNSNKIVADSNGKAEAYLTDGTYSFGATKNGYGSQYGSVEVAGVDKIVDVVLMTDQQLVQHVADGLQISYAAGDSASAVSQTIGLLKKGQDHSVINWKSSNPEVINSFGGVYPAKNKTTVTLTATVSKNAAIATKDFTVTVLAKSKTSGNRKGDSDSKNDENIESIDGTFTDLGTVPWAREAILALAEAGIINGTSDTTFSPEQNIKRGDFTVLLIRMLKPKGEATENFIDVPANRYYFKEIALAKKLGIANGEGGNQFFPEASISRQDMMVLTYRALLLTDKLEQEDVSGDVLTKFVDGKTVARYAAEGVSRMVKEGFITGDDTAKISPENNTTRAETAVFLYRIYQQK